MSFSRTQNVQHSMMHFTSFVVVWFFRVKFQIVWCVRACVRKCKLLVIVVVWRGLGQFDCWEYNRIHLCACARWCIVYDYDHYLTLCYNFSGLVCCYCCLSSERSITSSHTEYNNLESSQNERHCIHHLLVAIHSLFSFLSRCALVCVCVCFHI